MPSSALPMQIPIPTNGLVKNQPPVNVGFNGLIDGENWVYRDGRFFTRPGLTDFADDITDRPMGFIQYDDPSEANRLIMGALDTWKKYDSGTGLWTDITEALNGLSGGNTAQQVFRTFESSGKVYVLGCNGANVPKKWHSTENAGKYDDIPGVPANVQDATCMVVANDRLLLASGQYIYASDNLDFNAWTEGYYVILADTPGDIVSMLEFGNDQFAVYKENSIYMGFSQADLTAKYRFEMIRAGISGPVSPLSVITLGESGQHCYLAESGDVMVFDGNSIRSLGEHIRVHIRQTRDFDSRKRSFGFYDPLQNDVYFFYVSNNATDVDSAAVINLETGSLHSYRFPNHTISAGGAFVLSDSVIVGDLGTIDLISMTFAEMDRGVTGILLGENGGQVYHNQGTTDDGSAINAWFETGLQVGPEVSRFNLLHQVEHFFPTSATAQNVSVYLGASDYGEDIAYTAAQTLAVGSGGPYLTGHRLPGRMYSIKMQASATAVIEWIGSVANLTPTGLR